ncbi:MAG TPA: J domain-containing protein [Candidatus Acidoferrales bacterium]|nr:J domain-containing protein [Candidatus Acidoferrales bacterium]
MSQPDYYQILGVSPAASAEKIKSAHRKLIKKYHPDLYRHEADKARATQKLQMVNEAYAVLGDPARRRQYDGQRSSRTSPLRAAEPEARQKAAAAYAAAKPKPARARFFPKAVLSWWKQPASRRRAGYILGALAIVWLAFGASEEPQAGSAWLLLENTVVEAVEAGPSPGAGASPSWSAIGRFDSRARCSDGLRQQVKKDEQEGSKAVVDERGGTFAITVQVKGATRRVRHYECRATTVVQAESPFRRTLRKIGLGS